MSVTVEGDNLKDVQRKVWESTPRDWLKINPSQKDFGRTPSLGFVVDWKRGDEHFRREVPNEKALLKLIGPLIRDYSLWAHFQISAAEAERKRELKAKVDAARKELKAAEKAARG